MSRWSRCIGSSRPTGKTCHVSICLLNCIITHLVLHTCIVNGGPLNLSFNDGSGTTFCSIYTSQTGPILEQTLGWKKNWFSITSSLPFLTRDIRGIQTCLLNRVFPSFSDVSTAVRALFILMERSKWLVSIGLWLTVTIAAGWYGVASVVTFVISTSNQDSRDLQ